MPANQFLPFGTGSGSGANTFDPAGYAASGVRVTGYPDGLAQKQPFNTVARQTSTIAAMIGQFIADHQAGDVLDNGDVAALLAQFVAALGTSTGGAAVSVVGNSVYTATGFAGAVSDLTLSLGAGTWLISADAVIVQSYIRLMTIAINGTEAGRNPDMGDPDGASPYPLQGQLVVVLGVPATVHVTIGGNQSDSYCQAIKALAFKIA